MVALAERYIVHAYTHLRSIVCIDIGKPRLLWLNAEGETVVLDSQRNMDQ